MGSDQDADRAAGLRVRRFAGGLLMIVLTLGVVAGWAKQIGPATPPALPPGVHLNNTAVPVLAESEVQGVNAPTPFTAPAPAVPVTFTTAEPGSAAQLAIVFAMAQLGLPYVWGGDGPNGGDTGFDCSGLTTAAYAWAGIDLPRTAQTQYDRGPHVPLNSALRPGDLVFYGVPSRVHHVGLYVGGGRMVNAPTFGQPVQVAYLRWIGDDYLGATRPASGPGSIQQGPVIIPPTPAPAGPLPPAPTEFLAPAVPPEPPAAATTTQPPGEPPAAAALGASPAAVAPGEPQPPSAAASPESTPSLAGSAAPADPTQPLQTPTPPPAAPPVTPSPPAVPPVTPSPPAVPVTPSPPAPTPPPAPAPTLTLAAGTALQLVSTLPGPTGLPPAPIAAGTASLWVRTPANGPVTIVVVLAPGALTSTPSIGTVITLQGTGDASISRLVQSRTAMSPAAAAQVVAAPAPVLRVLLLAADPATGALIVVQAQ